MTLNDLANVATAITGAATTVIAVLVYRLTRSTDRWHKFDRRLVIYHATQSYLAGIVAVGTTETDNATRDWWKAVAGYKFLFSSELATFIDEIRNDGDQLDRINRLLRDDQDYTSDALRDKREIIWERMKKRFISMDRLFSAPLDFRSN